MRESIYRLLLRLFGKNPESDQGNWLNETESAFKSVSGLVVSLSLFIGIVFEFGKIFSVWYLTEGDVSLRLLLSVVSWSQFVTSSLAAAPFTVFFLFVLMPRIWVKSGKADGFETGSWGHMLAGLKVVVVFFALIAITSLTYVQGFPEACVKDFPNKFSTGSAVFCPGYTLAFRGESFSILHWNRQHPETYPNYYGLVVTVPTENIVMTAEVSGSKGCWEPLRSVVSPAFDTGSVRFFRPCDVSVPVTAPSR